VLAFCYSRVGIRLQEDEIRLEEEYQDVLQNLEFTVVEMYRDHPELPDTHVIRTYEALIEAYSAERAGRPARDTGLNLLEKQVFEAVREICQLRLGRADELEIEEFVIEPISTETLILCLKKLLNSARKWNRDNGRQGYLEFISQFV
jgi:hypothetical protein